MKTSALRIQTADEAARQAAPFEPRAVAVCFDKGSRRFVVDLSNETTFMFPARLCQGLAVATDEELEDVSITPSGTGLLWDRQNIDNPHRSWLDHREALKLARGIRKPTVILPTLRAVKERLVEILLPPELDQVDA